jgi:zinc/manganese transport system substrate-binding protein
MPHRSFGVTDRVTAKDEPRELDTLYHSVLVGAHRNADPYRTCEASINEFSEIAVSITGWSRHCYTMMWFVRRPHQRTQTKQFSVLAALAAFLTAGPIIAAAFATSGKTNAIGVENEYADVISQIGGTYVNLQAIETDPNTDPHTFEASPKIAEEIATAELIVVNGVGYDSWADKIISAAPSPNRKVINVQHLLGLPDDTANPHLWYDPRTMPAVAEAIAADLSALRPAQASYFRANAKQFAASLAPWNAAIASFKAQYEKTPVAVTEPVADDLLEAMGFDILTPWSLQAAVMNGTDPSPQDVTTENELLSGKGAKVFVYNLQATDSLTKSFLDRAKKKGVPVVGVYETMPTPGYAYQTWMLAETNALRRAVTDQVSTETLPARH